jgi:hypothetical protein
MMKHASLRTSGTCPSMECVRAGNPDKQIAANKQLWLLTRVLTDEMCNHEIS